MEENKWLEGGKPFKPIQVYLYAENLENKKKIENNKNKCLTNRTEYM